ncbi:LOW QUALITY PROTEIN: UDP-GalNAc:beta-1,3-N-acetylgalactosaminyltransferase 1 [Guaruba guarouba]
MRPLKWIFLFLVVFSVTAMWYVAFSCNTVIKHTNLMYFCEYEPVYKQHYLFTLWERLKCKDINPFLFILVSSHPEDVTSRQAIRMTWGSQSFWWGHILTLFLLGQDSQRENNAAALVEDESILYGDIIRQDVMDTYNNLTLKTIMAFWWVTEFCSNSRFLMMTDTDVFLNTANLIKFLLKLNSSEIFLLVILSSITLPKEALTKNHTSCMMNIHSGCTLCIAYILDGKLALRIYELMSHIKPIKFEDVYVGFSLNLLNVNISIPEDNQQFFLYKINFDICKYRHLIAVHGITSSEIIRSRQDLSSNTSVICL